VRCERERQLGRGDPAAVVNHADQLTASVFDFDDDVGRAGIDRVLDQLLHDRRRPLDDLAGGDAVDQGDGKLMNRPAMHDCRIIDQPATIPNSLHSASHVINSK
jgi:hypothetical protein